MAYACYAANCERKICNTYSHKIKMAISRRCWIVQIISAMRASELYYSKCTRSSFYCKMPHIDISWNGHDVTVDLYKCICNCAIPLNLKALRHNYHNFIQSRLFCKKESYQKPNQVLDRKKRAPLFLVQLGHLIFELQPLGGKWIHSQINVLLAWVEQLFDLKFFVIYFNFL